MQNGIGAGDYERVTAGGSVVVGGSMGISLIFKIAAIGIIITVICQILKKSDRDDIATLVSLAGLIIVLTLVIGMISELFNSIKDIFGMY